MRPPAKPQAPDRKAPRERRRTVRKLPDGDRPESAGGGSTPENAYRSLPAVERLLGEPPVARQLESLGRPHVTAACRDALEAARRGIAGGAPAPGAEVIAGDVVRRCRMLRHGGLRRVVNATGVVLHTNIGRAPLDAGLVRDAVDLAAGSVSLELDLDSGERGNRYAAIQPLLAALTGCELSLAVNNNAAAVLLVLDTFARGKEVILSRGELIEIGGSFRLPEIIRAGGARLVEVGTTNRTHLDDYRRAIGPDTGLIMKAHTSNYRVVGFTKQVPATELLELGQRAGLPVFEDLGSGSLVDLRSYGLTPEPTVQEVIASGVPIVSFSGDKLLGGPQAGIIAGKRERIAPLLKNHLLRALRTDKLTTALLQKTLQGYLDPAGPGAVVPIHRLLARSLEQLSRMATDLVESLAGRLEHLELRVSASESAVGGGACPTDSLPTRVVEVRHPAEGAGTLAARLRRLETPVLGRIQDGVFRLDMRTVFPEELELLKVALAAVDRA